MEKNHVVVDLDTFLELQRRANSYVDIIENHVILSKKVFKLEKNYNGEKINLTIDKDEILGIIDELSSESNLVDGYKLVDTINDTVAVGEYDLYFGKESEEKEDA